MMKILIKCSLPAGLLIWVIYRLVSRMIEIKDAIGIPMMIVSVILMMIGIVYHGWCYGKGKNPYERKSKK